MLNATLSSSTTHIATLSLPRALKLRYICRLYAKKLRLKNFPGYSPNRLLERMVELSLYTEEHLR
jgi:hypothetical protein